MQPEEAKGYLREMLRAALRPRTHLPRTSMDSPGIPRPAARMGSTTGGENQTGDPGSDPKVIRFRQLVQGDLTGGWNTCWEEGVTPWDLGQPTPVIQQLIQTGSFPKGRVLVPGCGTGYDVVALANPNRYVVGLDISDSALRKAKELSASLPNASYFSFLKADFFTWHPNELFDVIFDYTFFCAIDPCLRSAWAKKIGELLKPDGELITLILLISDQVENPPYNTSVADYEDVLHPLGFNAISIEDNELAVQNREVLQCGKGREKLGRWKRCLTQPSL